MADTYGVQPAAIAAELPGLFPGGFGAGTVPTDTQVAAQITTADTMIALYVRDATGQAPSADDAAAVLAVRFIVVWVVAQVLRTVYAGNDPEKVTAATSSYVSDAAAIKAAITAMGAQAVGDGEPAPRVLASTDVTRRLVLDDDDLSGGRCRDRKF